MTAIAITSLCLLVAWLTLWPLACAYEKRLNPDTLTGETVKRLEAVQAYIYLLTSAVLLVFAAGAFIIAA